VKLKISYILRGFIGLAVIIAAVVAFVGFILAVPKFESGEPTWGVTFSRPQAEAIGLDWQETYEAALKDLGVRKFRLSAYWNVIEPQDDVFDFESMDYQMDKAAEYDADVILSIGRKLPRWPECHTPKWATGLSEREQQKKVLEMLPVVVNRYKSHPALRMWQLENEPLLNFGVCPEEDREFLETEEALIRSLDDHPIMITDSGELNSWLGAAQFGDLVGTTMYRTVFSDRTQKHFFYDYIFPSWGYRLKARYVKLLHSKEVLISELQGEPWGARAFVEMTDEEKYRSFSPDRFRELADFAERTQLPEAYWWGFEYWYWEKEVNGNDAYWRIAREIFKDVEAQEKQSYKTFFEADIYRLASILGITEED